VERLVKKILPQG